MKRKDLSIEEVEKSIKYLSRVLGFDEKTKQKFERLCMEYLVTPRFLLGSLVHYLYKRVEINDNPAMLFRDLIDDLRLDKIWEEEKRREEENNPYEPTAKEKRRSVRAFKQAWKGEEIIKSKEDKNGKS